MLLLVAVCYLLVFVGVMTISIFIVIAAIAALGVGGLFMAKFAGYVPESESELLR